MTMKIHNRLTPYRSGSVISLVVLLCADLMSASFRRNGPFLVELLI